MKTLHITLVILISVLIFSSCNRKIRYIYDGDHKNDTAYIYNNKSYEYRLKPKDVLHVKIITTDKKINELFKIDIQGGNTMRTNNGGEFYLSGFTVNDSGYVQIPVLGSLPAAGKTVQEFRNTVTLKTHEFLNDAIVNVKFVSFKISFLGEVKKEGPIYIYQDNIDILEAVSRAGGVTEYGKMTNVTVVRQGENQRIVYKLDLTDRKLLTSDKFYLYPDDIIIVEPMKTKIAQMNFRDYFYFFSAISSAVTTTVIMISLFKK